MIRRGVEVAIGFPRGRKREKKRERAAVGESSLLREGSPLREVSFESSLSQNLGKGVRRVEQGVTRR